MQALHLPLGTPESEPHIPILVSPNLPISKRITVLFGERNQDLGVFAYRIIGGDEGINAGSAVDFVRAIQAEGPERGIVIANPGQLIWCRSQGRAMGRIEWEHLPRESAVHPSLKLDEEEGRNLVRGNRDESEHVEYVFENVLKNAGAEVGGAKIDIIGAEWTGVAVIRYLGRHWSEWSTRVNGICLIAPLHGLEDLLPTSPSPSSPSTIQAPAAEATTSSFTHFISTRCRAYVVSDKPAGTLVEGRAEYGCNVYASGEKLYVECIIVRAWRDMLGWLGKLGGGEEGCEEVWEMPEEDGKEGKGDGGRVDEGWVPDGSGH